MVFPFQACLLNSREPRFARPARYSYIITATSWVDFRSAECVPPRPSHSRSAECVPPIPRLISGRQNVFCRIPGQFPFSRVCSAMSWIIFGRQSVFHQFQDRFPVGRVFRHVPGRFPFGRVCSATSRVDFRSAECVPPRSGLISGRQSVFRSFI